MFSTLIFNGSKVDLCRRLICALMHLSSHLIDGLFLELPHYHCFLAHLGLELFRPSCWHRLQMQNGSAFFILVAFSS